MTAPCVAVLVVEDDPDIRENIVMFLQLEGFHVFAASNGLEAMNLLAQIPQPALILADMMMPVMDGPALLSALRHDDQFATVPVVIVSSLDDVPPGYRRIKKPFDLDHLVKLVSEFCVRRI